MRTFVVYEDRPDQMIGLKLCLLSLRNHHPSEAVVVYLPSSLPGVERWVRRNITGVEVRSSDAVPVKGWNVKPTLLLRALADGADDAVWLDSDVVVARPLGYLLGRCDPQAFLVASDHHLARESGTDSRTKSWGLTVGRVLPKVANTGFIRVTRSHTEILQTWARMLEDPDYRAAQARPGHLRPLHQVGDQEVLSALLGSELALGTPVSMLRVGVDMAQCEGARMFTLRQRMDAIRSGGPYLVHAMGTPKPWQVLNPEAGVGKSKQQLRARVGRFLRRGHATLGPYACLASSFADSFTDEPNWFRSLPRASRLCASPRLSSLPEIPVVLAAAIADRFPRVGT